MRGPLVPSLLVFATAIALVACGSTSGERFEPVCPPGWTGDAYSEGSCRPSDATIAESRTTLTTGITGFARVTTGTCNLCEQCTCNTRLVEGLDVHVFVASDVDEERRSECTRAHVPSLPLARTSTDVNGLYSFKLAAGDYVVVADDPATEESSRCPAFRPVTVQDDVALAPLVFDHGAY